jgi:hypothetical protein
MVSKMRRKLKDYKLKTIMMIGFGVLFMAVVASLIFWDTPRNKVEFIFFERTSIEQAVRAYFQAEIEHNLQQIYARLAPSSNYRKTHTYLEFLQDVGDSPVKIQTYRILDIYSFRNNENKENYPAVEKMVQVEVHIDVNFKDTGMKNTYNHCFTFLKEKGVWYKG